MVMIDRALKLALSNLWITWNIDDKKKKSIAVMHVFVSSLHASNQIKLGAVCLWQLKTKGKSVPSVGVYASDPIRAKC